MQELDRLREQLSALMRKEEGSAEKTFGFREADQLLSAIYRCIQDLLASPTNSAPVLELILSLQNRTVALCAEGIKAEDQIQALLRLSSSLIDTVEIQRSVLKSHGIGLSPLELDDWIAQQIAHLDPDHS